MSQQYHVCRILNLPVLVGCLFLIDTYKCTDANNTRHSLTKLKVVDLVSLFLATALLYPASRLTCTEAARYTRT